MIKKAKSFLGQGWSFPPSFVRDLNSVVLTGEDQNIQENLSVLLGTQCGERLMNESYGTTLRSFVFEDPDGDTLSEIQDTVKTAVLLYEPRIKLLDVKVSTDTSDQSTIRISLEYTIRTNNSRRNFVYPFHITEGTNLIQAQ